jgi:hypothetical protein
MRNNFCRLVEPELKKLDADVPLDLMGMLWSPFHMTERNGYIHVPVESFQEITNFLTDHALHLAAARQQHAAQDARQQRLADAEKPQPLFVATVLRKLRRFEECASDGEGADIERHWFDILTHLGLLNRVQRSPAWWELTDEAERFLASPGCADGEKAPVPALNLPRRKVKTEYSTAEEDAQADAWNAALDAVQELNR